MAGICTLIGHHRSAKRAKFNCATQRWQSVCTVCGQAMVRLEHRNWRLKAEVGEDARIEPSGARSHSRV